MRSARWSIVTGFLVLVGCEMVIDPDLPQHVPRLVAQGFFEPTGAWGVYVEHSYGILEPRSSLTEPLTEATVEVLSGAHVVDTLRFSPPEELYIFAGASLKAGVSYTLQVSAPGFETVQATDVAPEPMPVSVVSWALTSVETQGNWTSIELSVSLQIHDPSEEKNYYQLRLFSMDESANRNNQPFHTKDRSIIDDTGYDGSVLEDSGEFFGSNPLFKDALFDGKTHRINLLHRMRLNSRARVTYVLEVRHVSLAYYDYFKTVNLHDEIRENPFAEPVVVYSNVENGYGIFAGYSTQTFEFEKKEE